MDSSQKINVKKYVMLMNSDFKGRMNQLLIDNQNTAKTLVYNYSRQGNCNDLIKGFGSLMLKFQQDFNQLYERITFMQDSLFRLLDQIQPCGAVLTNFKANPTALYDEDLTEKAQTIADQLSDSLSNLHDLTNSLNAIQNKVNSPFIY